MLPAYLAVIILFIQSSNLPHFTPRIATILGVFGLLLLVGAAVLAAIFPVFSLPKVTGKYEVGTLTLELTNNSRLGSNSQVSRNDQGLAVQLFYPAERGSGGSYARYMDHVVAPRFAPQLALVRTQAVVSAAIARSASPFPVIIYAHSWNGNRQENRHLLEELASHGYVVASYDDPYSTPLTAFPDGKIVVGNRYDRFLDFSSDQTFRETRQILHDHLMVGANDVRFILDTLTSYNIDSNSRFYKRLDTTNAGALGFSFGGTIAVEACRLDPRFKAGVNLDGYSFGINSEPSRIQQPLMVVWDSPNVSGAVPPPNSSGTATIESKFDENDYRNVISTVTSREGAFLEIRGADHRNFSESPLYSRVRRYGGGGVIDPRRAIKLVSVLTVSFFDKHLRGMYAPSWETPSSDYPEVRSKISKDLANKAASS
jgi:dienelactone hydrolase